MVITAFQKERATLLATMRPDSLRTTEVRDCTRMTMTASRLLSYVPTTVTPLWEADSTVYVAMIITCQGQSELDVP